MHRRGFLRDLIAGATAAAAIPASAGVSVKHNAELRYLRPPGALDEEAFKARCIRCGQCGEACPNRCINFFGFENGLDSLDTPYIVPREQACILCMKCGQACPTGAIAPLERTAEAILGGVKMGQAEVDEALCL